MRYFLFSILFFASHIMYAQTGIGTTTPINKFEVVTAAADPASSGLSANGNLRLGTSSGSHVLDFGLSSTSTYAWLQARSKSAYGTTYNLSINPNGGNVGIGTAAPACLLTVGKADGSINGELLLNPTAPSNEGGQLVIKRSLSGGANDWTIDSYGDNLDNARLRIFNGSDASAGLSIRENGFIGLGNTTPTVRLHVSGDIIANSIAGSSDIRFKTNIRPVENALEKVKALRGVYFNWNQKSFSTKEFSDMTELGFIAQEVEKVIPELVIKDKTQEEYRSVKYDKVVALLVEAIKEQQQQIDRLTIKVNKLSKKQNK